MTNFPAPEQVKAISAENNPVLRNLQITHCYYELSALMTKRLGQSANWCTFAAWASRQAGQSIRKEDMQRGLEHLFGPPAENARGLAGEDRSSNEDLIGVIWRMINPGSILEHASDAVARGNKKVFEEIGLEFSRFIETFLEDTEKDPAKCGRFVHSLLPGAPPEGQQYLRQAFSSYYEAFWETDPKKKAERILYSNICIGFHEQTRLQPEITEALNAALPEPELFAKKILQERHPNTWKWILAAAAMLRKAGISIPFIKKINRSLESVRLKLRTFLTQKLMAIGLAEGKYLLLGTDLTASFPESLRNLQDPELLALLSVVDTTPNSLKGSGALDWANLSDRLHYIADLFRCYQETAMLLDPPFLPGQIKSIQEGRVPEGKL